MRWMLVLCLAVLSGCSATSLRCGSDGDSSYVELVNLPQDLSSSVRYYKDLCGFQFEAQEDQVKLNIIDPEDL
jgi:hypothetical protein